LALAASAAVAFGTALGVLLPLASASGAPPVAAAAMLLPVLPLEDTDGGREALVEILDPIQWKSPEARCQRRRGRRFCDGPRRVPEPYGDAAVRAAELGMGDRWTGAVLIAKAPPARWVEAAEGEAESTLLWPVDGAGHFVRGLGRARGRRARPHQGVDLSAPEGTPVLAANDGLVAYADNELTGYGNVVMVIHPDGTVTLYAHLAEGRFFPGQAVRRGEVLGLLGNTGLSQGPHLHFEWRVGGRPRNPLPLFEGRPAGRARGRGPSSSEPRAELPRELR
jgi:hypothetical protein